MKREKILKVVLVLIIGAILFAMSTNVYAVEDDIYLDIQDSLPTDNTNTNTGTTTNTISYVIIAISSLAIIIAGIIIWQIRRRKK